MQLEFWGAAQTVTGSLHVVHTAAGQTILLDCGLFQGRRSEARERNRTFPVDPSKVHAVVLSHAHIDHCGLLPKLWAEGFRGRIWSTHATRDLCGLLLMDSAYIQEKDAEFYNRRMRKKGQEEIEALYSQHDAERCLERFVSVGYREKFEPADGVTCEFRDAGHILGSATVTLEETANGKTVRLGFTGDIGNPDRPILRDPQPMDDLDHLICESTYGGRTHEPPGQAKAALAAIIKRTSARGGKVIIPAFAVGRTQEIVYILDQLTNEGELPPIPVFVDSPLAVNATGVFMTHPECYDRDLLEYLRTDDNAFGFERLEYVRKAERSKQLNDIDGPSVVISASGMCEAGRILHHLRHNISDPRATVLIVGYQAEHTLGRRLVEKREEVKIFGQPHQRTCDVEVLNHYSAHADEPGVVSFVGQMDPERLKRIYLVHGDPDRQAKMKTALAAAGHRDVAIPARGDSFAL